MPAWFYNLHVVIALILIYAIFGFIGYLGYLLNKKFFKFSQNNNQNGSLIYAAQQTGLTFGTLFIAFWIALNWQTLGDLNLISESEAHAVQNLYSSAEMVDNVKLRDKVQLATNDYLNSVINDEYKSLEQGELSQITTSKFNYLSNVIYSLPAQDMSDKFVYAQLVSSLNSLTDYRLKRLDYASGQINGVLLVFFLVLITLICFWSGCTNHRNGKLTALVLISQYLIILSSAWLILEIDRPFQGYFKVDNHTFVMVKQQIAQMKPDLPAANPKLN